MYERELVDATPLAPRVRVRRASLKAAERERVANEGPHAPTVRGRTRVCVGTTDGIN